MSRGKCEWQKCPREATRALTLVGIRRPLYECDEHAGLIREAHLVVADRPTSRALVSQDLSHLRVRGGVDSRAANR